MQGLQPNFMTDGIRNFMAQQKQRKQLIIFLLTISNHYYRYNPISWLTAAEHTYQVLRRQPKSKNILAHTATTTNTMQFYDW